MRQGGATAAGAIAECGMSRQDSLSRFGRLRPNRLLGRGEANHTCRRWQLGVALPQTWKLINSRMPRPGSSQTLALTRETSPNSGLNR